MPGARRAGGINKRCECRGGDGKRLGSKCPKLSKRNHGNQELPPGDKGTRRRFRRTGYATGDAETDLSRVRAILDLAGDDEEERAGGTGARMRPGLCARPACGARTPRARPVSSGHASSGLAGAGVERACGSCGVSRLRTDARYGQFSLR